MWGYAIDPDGFRYTKDKKVTIKYHLIITLIFFSITTKMEGQLNSHQKKSYLILQEEHQISEFELQEFEKIKRFNLPEDYRNFLLKYNGGVVHPSTPKKSDIFPIERFYSLGDMKLGVIANQREIREHVKYDIANRNYNLDFNKLLFIGVCEIGNLLIYCGEEDYGAIYKTNYSGGEGLLKSRFSSFSELLNNLKWSGDGDDKEYFFDEEKAQRLPTDKVFTFDYLFYWEEDVKEESFKRFKEVLDFYGHPNKEFTTYYSSGEEKEDVVSYYINEPKILEYLLSIGGKTSEPIKDLSNLESLKVLLAHNANLNGILNSTRSFEVIKFLIEEDKQDINLPYNGEYPLMNLTNVDDFYSAQGRIYQYELLENIFSLGHQINLTIEDEKGRTIKERIEIIKERYIEAKNKN